MSDEVILAVDDVREELFKNNPTQLKNLVGKEIKPTNITALQDKVVKKLNGSLISLEKCETILLTPSYIYKNVYYPTHEFDELYRKDLSSVMYDLACKMGAKSYKSDFEIKIKKEDKKTFLSKFKSFFKFGQTHGNGTMNIKFETKKEIDLAHKKESIEEGKELVHYSPNKLRDYINEQSIDIQALPPEFAVKVRQYLQGDSISSRVFKNTEKTSGVVQNITEFSFNLSAKLENNAGEFLGDAFSDFKKIKNFEFASQIGYEIEFAPKPNE